MLLQSVSLFSGFVALSGMLAKDINATGKLFVVVF